jgi:hypothetical protein
MSGGGRLILQAKILMRRFFDEKHEKGISGFGG